MYDEHRNIIDPKDATHVVFVEGDFTLLVPNDEIVLAEIVAEEDAQYATLIDADVQHWLDTEIDGDWNFVDYLFVGTAMVVMINDRT